MRIAFLILVFALSVYGRPLLAPMYKVDADKRIPGRYLVTLKEDSSAKLCLDDVIRDAEELTKDDSGNFFVAKRFQLLDMFVAEMSETALNLVRSIDAVAYVEEVSIFHLAAVSSWGLDRIDQRDLPLDDTFTPRGDGAGVNVYVVDTGIRYTHSDFNGRAKFFHDAFGDDGADCNGHGSHCAGTATGSEYGVAKMASVYAVRVMSCVGFGSTDGIIGGIEAVIANGKRPGVVSMSIGGTASPSLDNVMNFLRNAGFTIVVAAGNSNADACYTSPARSASVITVGATGNTDRRAAYSNYGNCLNLFAPGTRITSAWNGGDDSSLAISGTSMACPHVAGAAAVLLGENPSMSHDDVKRKLLADASVNKLTNIGEGSPNLLLYLA